MMNLSCRSLRQLNRKTAGFTKIKIINNSSRSYLHSTQIAQNSIKTDLTEIKSNPLNIKFKCASDVIDAVDLLITLRDNRNKSELAVLDSIVPFASNNSDSMKELSRLKIADQLATYLIQYQTVGHNCSTEVILSCMDKIEHFLKLEKNNPRNTSSETVLDALIKTTLNYNEYGGVINMDVINKALNLISSYCFEKNECSPLCGCPPFSGTLRAIVKKRFNGVDPSVYTKLMMESLWSLKSDASKFDHMAIFILNGKPETVTLHQMNVTSLIFEDNGDSPLFEGKLRLLHYLVKNDKETKLFDYNAHVGAFLKIISRFTSNHCHYNPFDLYPLVGCMGRFVDEVVVQKRHSHFDHTEFLEKVLSIFKINNKHVSLENKIDIINKFCDNSPGASVSMSRMGYCAAIVDEYRGRSHLSDECTSALNGVVARLGQRQVNREYFEERLGASLSGFYNADGSLVDKHSEIWKLKLKNSSE